MDTTSGPSMVIKRGPMGKQILQNKKNSLKQIIIEQLQHYSKTGERLYSKKEVQAESGFSHNSLVKYTKIILEQIFTDYRSASLIYDMILGRITTSYQKTKENCIENGLLLKTTSTQWFDMLKNRGDTSPSRLYVEVKCTAGDHESSIRVGSIRTCGECHTEAYLNSPLNFKDVLNLGSERNIQAISFFDDSQQLTESEFNELVKAYKAQHQDPNDYKSKTIAYLNLKWKCLECDRVFERTYDNIQRSKIKHYCPSCVSSIDQQMTLESAEGLFQDYTTQSFRSDVQLTRFLPDRILLMNKYQVISHPNVHVDIYGVISVGDKEFKIAIEHQGPQHYSFESYLEIIKSKDIASGIYKTDEKYKEMYDALIERDKAKVQLFKDLKKQGYYLIVVPYKISPAKRESFILEKFIEQTNVNPGQPSIADYL